LPVNPEKPEERHFAVDLVRLLQYSPKLFGEPLLGSPAIYQEPRRLLALVAQTYHNRRQFRRPARMVYNAYREGRVPAAVYWNDPSRYLPADFVTLAGLPSQDSWRGWSPTPALEPVQAFTQSDGCLAPTSPETSQAPSSSASGVDPEDARHWRAGLDQLNLELDRGIYLRYVQNLILVDCDLETGECTVGCRDQGSQEWLESRLKRRLERLFIGVWAREVRVTFLVWTDPEDESGGDDMPGADDWSGADDA
jgi:hypothetical protein